MTPVQFSARDEREVNVPIPCDGDDLARLSTLLHQAMNDGYKLANARALQGGDQRDPYTVGLRLTFTKEPA